MKLCTAQCLWVSVQNAYNWRQFPRTFFQLVFHKFIYYYKKNEYLKDTNQLKNLWNVHFPIELNRNHLLYLLYNHTENNHQNFWGGGVRGTKCGLWIYSGLCTPFPSIRIYPWNANFRILLIQIPESQSKIKYFLMWNFSWRQTLFTHLSNSSVTLYYNYKPKQNSTHGAQNQ